MISNPIINGGVYFVSDKAITLPPNYQRNYHDERRPVLVLSGPSTNSFKGWPTVLFHRRRRGRPDTASS